MMLPVFAAMFTALVLGWFGRRGLALIAIAACLALAIYEFQYEIYSPEYGFGMPWIQTLLDLAPAAPKTG